MRSYLNIVNPPAKAFLIAGVLAALPSAAAAQGVSLGGIVTGPAVVPPATYSLSQVIARSLGSSSSLQIQNRTLNLDAARVKESEDTALPKMSASAVGMHYDMTTAVAFGGETIIVQPQDQAILGLNAALPIDLTGQIKAQTDVYRLQALSDRFTRDALINNTVLAAETDYFNVLRAQHQVQVAQSTLAEAQEQQNVASREYAAGTGQRVDLLRANTQVANAQQNLLQANNALSLSRINLNDLLGRPLNADTSVLDVAGVTTGVAAQPGAAAPPAPVAPPQGAPAAPETNMPAYFAPPMADIQSINIDQSIATAINVRPELRSDIVNIQAASRAIKLARAGLEPTLTLNAIGNYYTPTSFEYLRQVTGELQATLNVPIFDSGVTHQRVIQARDSQGNAQTTYDAHKTDVAKQVRQAYLNLLNAAQQISSANIALQQAVAARQLAETRYSGGVGLYLEVTDAEAAQTAAETSQVNAVYDYLVARAQYENAIGMPNLNPTLPTTLITTPSALPATPPELPAITSPTPAPANPVPAPGGPAQPGVLPMRKQQAPGAQRSPAQATQLTSGGAANSERSATHAASIFERRPGSAGREANSDEWINGKQTGIFRTAVYPTN